MIDFAFNFSYLGSFGRDDLAKDIVYSLENIDISGSIITTPDLFFFVKDILAEIGRENENIHCFPLVENGVIDLAKCRATIDENVVCAVISAANFETGVITPLSELSEMIKSPIFIVRPPVSDKNSDLTDKLRDGILEKFPFSRSNTPADRGLCLPNTVSISFRNINGESIAARLNDRGMNVKTGSACASANKKPSKTLQTMNVPYDLAMGSIHFSLAPEITEEDINLLIRHLTDIIGDIRKYSFD